MDGIVDDIRMLSVRGWGQKALDRREKCFGSSHGPNWAVEPLVEVNKKKLNSTV
jgi:hypothetical protein